MFKHFLPFPLNRTLWGGLALGSATALCIALYYQYIQEAAPCILCVYIRLAFLCTFLFSLLQSLYAEYKALVVILMMGNIVSAFWGIQIAYELFDLQTNPPLMATCSFSPDFWLPLEQWAPWFFLPTGSCTDEATYIIGLSMASWSLIGFGLHLVTLLLSITFPSSQKLNNR